MTLLEYLPPEFGGPEVSAMEGALDEQVRALWKARDGLMDQLNVDKATWGLSAWEEMLGLETDVSRPERYRRSRIKSKLRGQGTTTVALIRNVAESFSNGAVDVIEHPAEYRVDVKFTGTIGLPPNMEDLSAALSEIIPAHVAYDYIIIFRTWGKAGAKTWGGLAGNTWGEVKGGSI